MNLDLLLLMNQFAGTKTVVYSQTLTIYYDPKITNIIRDMVMNRAVVVPSERDVKFTRVQYIILTITLFYVPNNMK